MGQVVYLGLCLLGCLIFNPLVEGAEDVTVAARARCPPGVLYYKQFCYELYNMNLDWDDAELKCQEREDDAHLASIHSSNEGRILASFLKGKGVSSCTWIGLAGAYVNRRVDWEWSDGSPFSGYLWDGRSPGTAYSFYCICLTNIQNSNYQKWEQRTCHSTFPFVCKYRSFY